MGRTAETRRGDVRNMRGYSGHATSVFATQAKGASLHKHSMKIKGTPAQFDSVRLNLSDIECFSLSWIIKFDFNTVSKSYRLV